MQHYNAILLKNKLKDIFERYPLELVYFFGSHHKGKVGPLSDVDLAVLWREEVKTPQIRSIELQNEIKKYFNDDRFEVGPLDIDNLSFCYNVISSGVCIYGTEEYRVRFETDILNRFLDFSYLAEEYNRAFKERMKKW